MEVGALRSGRRLDCAGIEIFSCPGLVEGGAGLDWQAWAVGAGDFRRPLRCGDGVVRSRLGAHAWGWGGVRRVSWLDVRIHPRNFGLPAPISRRPPPRAPLPAPASPPPPRPPSPL